MKKFGFTRKIFNDFQVFTVVVVTFLLSKSSTFCFGMCLFPEDNQQPVLGSHRFSDEKWQFSLDVKQKHTFYRRKSTKIDKVSPSYKNILLELLTIQQQQHSVAIWDQVATLVRIPSYSSETVGGKESRCGPRNHGVSFVCSRR